MTSDPKCIHTVNSPSLFFTEAVARLRIANEILASADEAPDDWGGDGGGWAQHVAMSVIEDVAKSLEDFAAAREEAAEKAGADGGA